MKIIAINMAIAISLAAFLFVFLAIVYIIIVLNCKVDKDKVVFKDQFDDRVRKVCREQTMARYIEEIVQNEIRSSVGIERDMREKSPLDMNKLEQIVRDAVKKELNAANEVKHVGQDANVTRDSNMVESVLYASCVNESDNTFYEVTTAPKNDTIYLLMVDKENLASFQVYEKMFDKVKEEQDHLKEGCDVENLTTGSISSMQTKVMGQAARQDDGKWKVTKKANVIFK